MADLGEESKTEEEIMIANVGKLDPKRHLKEDLDKVLGNNISNALGAALDSVIF